MRKLAMLALASVLAASSVTVASAAVIKDVVGKVSLNIGKGFQPVIGPMDAPKGAVVMATIDSSAAVVYEDGCRVLVLPGSVVRVLAKSPCTGKPGSGFVVGGVQAMGVKDKEDADTPIQDQGNCLTSPTIANTLPCVIILGGVGVITYGIFASPQ